MNLHKKCDFCDRPDTIIPKAPKRTDQKLIKDTDGLWACWECQKKLRSSPTIEKTHTNMPPRLQALVGKSAGHISMAMDLPYKSPFIIIIDAAGHIAYDNNLYMSAWRFAGQFDNETTLWRSPDGERLVAVSATLQMERLH